MKHYHAKDLEMTKEGFTDLFILNTSNLGSNSQAAAATPTNDFSVGFSSQNINLTALNAKDVVLDAMIDINTNIVGPTGAPTAQVKTSSGGVAITNTVNVLTGSGALRDNTVVGAANSAGNEIHQSRSRCRSPHPHADTASGRRPPE